MRFVVSSSKTQRSTHSIMFWMIGGVLSLLLYSSWSARRAKTHFFETGVVSAAKESVLLCASEALIAIREHDQALSFLKSKLPLMHDCLWRTIMLNYLVPESSTLANALNRCYGTGTARSYIMNQGEMLELCEGVDASSGLERQFQCQRIELQDGRFTPARMRSRKVRQIDRSMDLLIRIKNPLTLDEFTTVEIHCFKSNQSRPKSKVYEDGCIGFAWTLMESRISLSVQYTTSGGPDRVVARLAEQSVELTSNMHNADSEVAKMFTGDFLNLLDVDIFAEMQSDRLHLELTIVTNDQESVVETSVPVPCRSLLARTLETPLNILRTSTVSVDFSSLEDIAKKNKATRTMPRREISQIPSIADFLRISKTYISLTTSPHRLRLIHHVLDTLDLSSVAAIFIALPVKFGKDKLPYRIPADFEDRLGMPVPVHLLRPIEDIGPLTKLLPAVRHVRDVLKEPDSIVITVDDDSSYPWGTINELILGSVVNANSIAGLSVHPATMWGVPTASCLWSPERQLIVAEGFGGVAYRAKYIDDHFILAALSAHKLCFVSDDLVIGFGICRRGVNVVRVNNEYVSREMMEQFSYGWQADALHHGAGLPDESKGSIEKYPDINSYKYQVCAQAIIHEECRTWATR